MTLHLKVEPSKRDVAVAKFLSALDRFDVDGEVYVRLDAIDDIPPSEPAAAPDGRWEYALLAISGDLVTGLNGLGGDRWELCAVTGEDKDGVIVVVKRPKSLIERAPQGFKVS